MAPIATPRRLRDEDPVHRDQCLPIAGTAGEQITLMSDSFSSTSGTWYLVDPEQ